jgi:UDP-glucose 4-epimerase
MRVLVSGAAGFVGSNVVSHLLRAGHDVAAMDDLSAGARPAWWRTKDGPECFEGTVEDERAVRRAMRGVDGVVHLAARPGVADSVARPDLDFRVNVLGTFTVLDAARRAGARTFVFASSGAVLAAARPPLREDMAPAPMSPYGASKLYGEGIVAASRASFGMTGVSLRFANVYGPMSGHKKSVVSLFLRRVVSGKPVTIYGTGRQTRDFLFVDDVARAVERALRARRPGVYHLGTGIETSVSGLVRAIERVAGRKLTVERAPARPADAARSFVDLTAARRDLRWEPRVSLDEGLARTLEWLRASTAGAT